MTLGEQSLEDWFEENQDEILQLQAFATSDMPDEPSKLALDLSRASRDGARAGFMLADAESFVLKAQASATVNIAQKWPEMNANEKKILAKADDNYLKVTKIRDYLEVIVSSLKSRVYLGMNYRRSSYMPAGGQEG